MQAKKIKKQKYTIISLGGSLIVPDNVDIKFLKNFRNIIVKYTRNSRKFIIICGGGRMARMYQNSARKINILTNKDLDWLGIYVTKVNAYLLKAIFGKYVQENILTNPERDRVNKKSKIIIASGWRPGASTDYDAILLAKRFKTEVINLTDIKYVYDKDPDIYKSAKPLKKISWGELKSIIGNKWRPGLNLPFDPLASREANLHDLRAVILKGCDLNNLERYLSGKRFSGTIIEN